MLTAGTMHASATEAGAAKPVTIMSGAQPISSGQNVDSQPIITTRVILDIVAAAIDLGYGIYFYSGVRFPMMISSSLCGCNSEFKVCQTNRKSIHAMMCHALSIFSVSGSMWSELNPTCCKSVL